MTTDSFVWFLFVIVISIPDEELFSGTYVGCIFEDFNPMDYAYMTYKHDYNTVPINIKNFIRHRESFYNLPDIFVLL